MRNTLELLGLFVCLGETCYVFQCLERQKWSLGCSLLGDDQYPSWHYDLQTVKVFLKKEKVNKSSFTSQITKPAVSWGYCVRKII